MTRSGFHSLLFVRGPCKNCSLDIQTAGPNQLERPHKISFETSVLSHTLVIKRDNIGHDIEGSL